MVNRRQFVGGIALLAGSAEFLNGQAKAQEETSRLPPSVAGVRLVDSTIARAATERSRADSPEFLFNHCVRTFLFGSLIGQALKMRFDREILYVACILHDLGLTERNEGELPFEIQGAEVAKKLLEEHAYDPARIAIVWDGIAMHASLISHYKQPEIRLVGHGASADVVGQDLSQIGKLQADEILRAFPRLQFKTAFLRSCSGVVRRHPGGAARSFMRDIGERYVPDFHPRNVCDLIVQAPFSE